ncbi:glutamyl-tRNA reductase [Halobacillus karajensis]|uniref:Glutamyl-tRNA reductase n=1 Tax=Halobacillus karajensis TaxID=195088 RepID=A0A024P662_9BACI|nr:glutamyl-tRNA reductase [Halobacillus karajensis]CDQ18192.1 Glutamyl-tRNA reductase [Halobacillus karajensis]CDQ24544.1 Glutamyl-tRNA reductase [Halobacillus karajensis]CDQ29209.1 Glutamyl-tRNA reductase [Halobacillus karajensis]SEH57506.1 glutamyl-tRNA reductase [Halobacillus karajensis]
MHILAVGLNYKTAPVEIREKLTFSENQLTEAMQHLNTQKSVLENVIISTCNRTEIYAVVDQIHTGRYYIKQFLAEWFDVAKEEFSPFLSIYETDGAIEHLLRVTSGLDSMVLGETQILGQMKQSFLQAQEAGTTGTIFNQLFRQAVTMAKKAHKETEIGENAVSVSYAAVELARKIFGDLVHKHIVILGAGKMGELAAKNLHGSGVRKVSVVNRTLSKAQTVAAQFNGQARTMDELDTILADADIVISSTGATEYVITKEKMEPIHKSRKGKPLFFVDIAVPRDLDPAMETLESVFLYDIDDLQGIVDANLALRKQAAEEIEVMIEAEIVAFKQWLQTIGVVPVISALRSKALHIQAETMKSIERKMPELSDRERKVLNKHTKSIINQMLKEPISQAKEMAAQPDSEETLQLFTQIFGIEEQVKKEAEEQEKKNSAKVKHSSEAHDQVSIISPVAHS